MKNIHEEAARALEGVGFTALEARLYVDLLRSGPLTGYRIAQHVGKATANAYKALDTLAKRGVVTWEDGPTRLYRAVPYAEVAATFSNDFQRRAQQAARALASLDRGIPDDRIYRLHDPGQIYERAIALLGGAASIAVIDAFPDAVERLQPALEAAARRGVTVTLHAYAPAALQGVAVVESPRAARVRERWPGTWLNLAVDGSGALIAHLLDEQRATGVWTQNAFVAWILHCGLASETALDKLARLATSDPRKPLADALETIGDLVVAEVPGRVALRQQLSQKTKKKGSPL